VFILIFFNITTTRWDSKVQVRYKGTFAGQTSGALYTVSQVSNYTLSQKYIPGETLTDTDVTTFTIVKDGVPLVAEHYLTHITINPNGETTVNID
jgi:hypothetical protein